MKHVFKVGDSVFARVIGFEPFPATVESVLLNESDSSVFYYVRFHGGSETVPIDANNLLSFAENRRIFRFKYNENELKKEAKLRAEALLGAEDDIPEVLMNFVTVDSDFEEVSNETVKRLGLYSITLTSHMVKTLGNRLSTKHSIYAESETEDEFVDVEEIPHISDQGKIDGSFPCLNCNTSWASSRSLECHLRQTKCGSIVKKGETEDENRLIRKMWTNRSVLGYYNCKLCYRRFRSKGEAQAHMSSKHRGIMKNVKIKVAVDDGGDSSNSDSDSMAQFKSKTAAKRRKRQGAPAAKIIKTSVESNCNANSSDSDSISQSRDADKHSSMERERRKALATKFEALSDVLSLDRGSSKVKILYVAQQHIAMLKSESETHQNLLEKLRNLNAQLQLRYSELK